MIKRLSSIALVLLLLVAAQLGALNIPEPYGFVNDHAGLLSPSAQRSLEARLQQFADSESTQVVVLTLASGEGLPIEQVAVQVFESWGIGQENKDNGVLLLVFNQERKLRIEVGYGLEGSLTDLLAGRILDSIMTPALRAGDADRAFIEAVDAILLAVQGEFTADDIDAAPSVSQKDPSVFSGLLFLFYFITSAVSRKNRSVGVVVGAVFAAVFSAIVFAGSLSGGDYFFVVFASFFAGAFGGFLLSTGFGTMLMAATVSGMGRSTGFSGSRSGGGRSFGGFSGGSSGGGGASGGW